MILRKPDTPLLINILLTISVSIFSVVYNIGAGTSILLNIHPTPINFSIKMLGFGINIFLILLSIMNKRILLKKEFLPLIIFWIIYSLRLLFDIQILGLTSNYQNLQIISYALGGSFSSIIAISLYRRHFNPAILIKIFYFILFFSNMIIILLLLLKPNETLLLFRRLSFGLDENKNQDIINAISISVNGGLLILMSLTFILFKKLFIEFEKYKFYIYSSLPLGLLNLLLGGSRGPLIALVLLSLIIFLQKKFFIDSINIAKVLKLFFTLVSCFLLIFALFISSERGKFVLGRIFADGQFVLLEDTNRNFLYNSAWNQFLRNPLIGDRYYEVISRSYPHNLILESLMATGVLGTFFLLLNLVILFLIFLSQRAIFTYSSIILYICFYWLLCDMVSGSIWGNTDLWVFSALAICAPYKFSKSFTESKVSTDF